MNLPDLKYKPELGRKTDYMIGIVGAGGIVDAAHLPAYQKAGFKVAGFRSLDEMLSDRQIESSSWPCSHPLSVISRLRRSGAGKHGCARSVNYQAATAPSLRGSVPPSRTPRSQSIWIA